MKVPRKWKMDFENETRQNIEIRYYELVSINVDLLEACKKISEAIIEGDPQVISDVYFGVIKPAIAKAKSK